MTLVQTFRLADGRGEFGLTCGKRGLDLAGVSLLRRDADRFRPRRPDEVAALLDRAYGPSVPGGRLAGGLQAVADALNEGAVGLAMIAAVQLRLPPLDWHGAVRILQADRALAKYNADEPRDWHGRWTTDAGSGGSVPPLLAPPHPQPATHPAAASPPKYRNPLFHLIGASEEGESGGLLGDFIELPREWRIEQYEALRSRLKEVEPDNPQLVILVGPNYVPSQADIDALDGELRAAQQRAGEPPVPDWKLGWPDRGIALELRRLGGTRRVPPNTPTIDDFSHGVVTSIKSIDLNARWYQDTTNLSGRINRYVGKLVEFDGVKWDGFRIEKDQIKGRVLDIVIPLNSGTPEQEKVMKESIIRAHASGVQILFNRY